MSLKKSLALLLAFALMVATSRMSAQGAPLPIDVLHVPIPPRYVADHDSDQANVTIAYTGHAAGQLWARVFLDTPDNLKKLVANTSSSTKECLTFHFFWRIPVDRNRFGILLDNIFTRFPSDSRDNASYTIVFEQGPEEASEKDILKLTRKDAVLYFNRAVPLVIHASADELERRRLQAGNHSQTAGIVTVPAAAIPRFDLEPPPCRTFKPPLVAADAGPPNARHGLLALFRPRHRADSLVNLADATPLPDLSLQERPCGL